MPAVPKRQVTRVFVADADEDNRKRAIALIDAHPALHVVGEGTGSSNTLRALMNLVPHVCVVGARLVGTRVPTFLRRVHEQLPATRCVRLPKVPLVARGSSTSAIDRFHDRVVGEFLADVGAAAGPSSEHSAVPGTSGFAMTARERDVLERLRAGLSDAEIADDLGLSVKTVRNALVGVLAKLGSDRAGEMRRGGRGAPD